MATVVGTARPDTRGDAWLKMPPLEEGPLWLRVGVGLESVGRRLREKYPEESFEFDIDFSLVEAQQRQLGMLEPDRVLSIFDFPHPTWAHRPGTYCSNCLAIDLGQFSAWDDSPWPDDWRDDDPFAEERAEDLRDRVPGLIVENHADCHSCGRDFILSKRQTWEMMVGIDEKLLCSECINRV